MSEQRQLRDPLENMVPREKYEALEEEFKAFAYIVSHDLNGPLRHAREFCKILLRNLGDKVDEKDQQYADFMTGGIEQMEKKLAGILAFSRVNTQGSDFEVVNVEAILEELVSLLNWEREVPVRVEKSALPEVFGDRKQIHQLFQILLDNAATYARPGIAPEVRVSAETKADRVVFSVRDNGMGIEEEFQEAVFGMFRRLHADDDIPGTGAGLTVARKIAQRHEGSVSLTSVYGEGTVVEVTLPASR